MLLETAVLAAVAGGLVTAGAGLRAIAACRRALAHRARLAGIIEASHDAIVSCATDRTILSWNRAAERLFGYGAAEVIGRDARMLLPPELAEASVAGYQRMLDGRPHVGYETVRLAKNGQRLQVSLTQSPVRDPRTGCVTSFALIFRDLRAQKAAEVERDRLAALVASSNDAIITRSLDGIVLSWNAGATRLFGYRPEEVLGRHALELFPDLLPASLADVNERLQRGEIVPPRERTRTTRAGLQVDVLVSVSPLYDAERRMVAVSATHTDLGELKRARSALAASEERLRATFDQAGVGMALRAADPRHPRWLRVNRKFCEIFGYAEAELLGLTSVDLTPVEDRDVATTYNEQLLRGDLRSYTREKRYVRKDGRIVWVNLTLSAVCGPDGTPTHMVSVIEDITARKDAERRIEYLSHYDALTQLPNRVLCAARTAAAIGEVAATGGGVALLFIDLDRFNVVNDSLGHDRGDALLRAVADRLAGTVRRADTVGRYGGDEFLVLLPGVESAGDAAAVAEVVLQSFATPFRIDGHELLLGATVGVAVYPDQGGDFDSLLRNAEAATYATKQAGRGHYQFYSPGMNSRALERLQLEQGLRQALENQGFRLVYQPQIDLASGELVGVEALLRWTHPELGVVPPARFIPVAEEAGLIVPLGAWALREACAQLRRWRDRALCPVPLSVNVSAIQFRQADFIDLVAAVIRDAGLPAHALELELTESIVMQDSEQVRQALEQLQRLGLKLAIDDFGTGYSSLQALRQLPIDRLKIDQSFVRDLPHDRGAAAITGAVVGMARSLGLQVVAEGVENLAQASFLAQLRCDAMQGYFCCRPLPADDLEQWMIAAPRTLALARGASVGHGRRGG